MRTALPVRFFLAVVLPVFAAPALAQESPEIPRLKPGSKEAQPATVYQWTAEAGSRDEDDGLRFTWSLPREYVRGKSYDLVVLCHGTGLDYRWGHANYKPDALRPGCIMVSPDGPTEADDGTRLFLGKQGDAIVFRDFVLEMTRSLPVDRIFLYGHSQGSFFVLFVAGQFPGITEGVVAHASGAWTETRLVGGIQAVPIAFMHGTADPVIPYGQSTGGRDAFVEAGHEMVLVRRMHGYNHWPNAVRAGECLDWCAAMSTTRADTALACAERLLAIKPKDEYGYECPPPFGGAYAVLSRVALEPDNAVEKPSEEQKTSAKATMDRIEAHARLHIEALKKDIKSKDDLVLGLGEEGGAWLGHLLAFREDFRGIPAVEDFIKEIGLDGATEAQGEACTKLVEVWYSHRPDSNKFEVATATIGECFLFDTLPSDLAERMKDMHARAEELKIGPEHLENYGMIEMWVAAREKGYARYVELCRQWK